LKIAQRQARTSSQYLHAKAAVTTHAADLGEENKKKEAKYCKYAMKAEWNSKNFDNTRALGNISPTP
jgi:hypothetical protein